MFYDNLSGLVRVLVIGPLAYVWLIAILRVTGKRTLAQLNAFDFIVTVALGSTLATVILSSSVSLAAGALALALALALLTMLQLVAAWASVRVPLIRRAITDEPTIMLRDGELDREALRRQRISEPSLRQTVRSAGYGGLELVAFVVLETNGKLRVISTSSSGSGSAVAHLQGSAG